MARFRSGTLERSVRRWGRFPRFGGRKFQKVAHAWKFIDVKEEALDRTAATVDDHILFDSPDWVADAGASNPGGVRNVSCDLRIGVTWTPQTQAGAQVFSSWRCFLGIWVLDTDDTGGTIRNHFAAKRPLWWEAPMGNNSTFDEAVETRESPRRYSWRVRIRQRYMGFDDQLRLKVAFDSDESAIISDARLWLFGRISWEIP